MCTIGYHKKLNVVFKNRDKNASTNEVFIIKPGLLAIRTEDSAYFSLGRNRHGCAFVSAAVNTPAWTSLAAEGKVKDAAILFKKENQRLINPIIEVSRHIPNVANIDELLEKILNSGQKYMGYNLILADKEKAVHVELYKDQYHVDRIDEMAVITNHFQKLDHGPKKETDYPNSFERLEAGKKAAQDFLSLEDIFDTLKPRDAKQEYPFWRNGNFRTISSSVIDLDADAIYFAPSYDNEYSRISGNIPPKGAEKTFMEMSRYIDLPTYHKIERGHPFYEEMLEEVQARIIKYYNSELGGQGKMNVLEIGAGTGLCSLELVKQPFLELDCLEIDSKCCDILSGHPKISSHNVILGDAITYCKPHHYDLLVSTFAHDHIHYNKRFTFAKNIYDNLKKGGRYIIGGEMLPYFSNDMERKKSLFLYHNHIIDLALKEDRVQVSELENNALKSGLELLGDFKRHEAMFEEEMESAGFKMISKKKMGPLNRDDVGGIFVYTFSV